MKNILPTTLFSGFQLSIRLLLVNVFFILANFPLLIFLLFSGGVNAWESHSLLLLLTALPLVPSSIALFKSVFTMIDSPDQKIYSLFWKSYKRSFSKESLIPLVLLLMIYFLSFDSVLYKVLPSLSLLAPIYFCLRILFLCLFPFLCLEVALFQNTSLALIKNGFIQVLSKISILFFNLIYLLFAGLIINDLPVALLFFIFSLYAYLFISFNYSSLHKRITECKSQQRRSNYDFTSPTKTNQDFKS